MFGKQGEKNNLEEQENTLKKGVVKNKEVIAEYDDVLNGEEKEGQRSGFVSRLDLLKEKLGLEDISFDSEIKTNLVDNDNVVTFIDWKSNLNIFISYFLIFIILISGSFAYLTFLEKEEKKKANIYDENILRTKEGIIREESLVDDGLRFQDKVIAIEALLDKHVYWTNLFKYLEENTLGEVSFSAFSGDVSGQYSFSSIAKNYYFTATEQIKVYENNKNTKSVSLSSMSLNEDKKTGETNISFNLKLEVDPNIFYKEK